MTQKTRPRRWISRLVAWVGRVISQPTSELDRWQRAVKFAYELGRHGAQQLRQDRASDMAAALAFRTLFALMPVMIVVTLVLKALLGNGEGAGAEDQIDQVGEWILRFLDSLGLDEIALGAGDQRTTLAQFVTQMSEDAAGLNLKALSWVGLGVAIYSAIDVMVTIEQSFNTIYRAPGGRSWARRVPLYWTVLTMAPLAIGGMYFLDSSFATWIESVGTRSWVLVTAQVTWGFLATWLLMIAIYKLVPNTTVSLQPLLAGSLVAAILLEVGKRVLGVYFSNTKGLNLLFQSVGAIPVLMFWVYLMWLTVLFGLEVCSILQYLGGRRLDEIEHKRAHAMGLVDSATVLSVISIIAERFRSGEVTRRGDLASEISVPDKTLQMMIDQLVRAKLIYYVQADEGAFCLARPLEATSVREILLLTYRLVDEGKSKPPTAILKRFRAEQLKRATDLTLASLADVSASERHSPEAIPAPQVDKERDPPGS